MESWSFYNTRMYMARKPPLFTVDSHKLEQEAREHLIRVATEGEFVRVNPRKVTP
jgi:hypothetical protein